MSIIREFKGKDLNNIVYLMEILDYKLPPETVEKNINLFLENKKNKIYVYEFNREVIGYIAIAIHHLLVTKYFRCRIENLVVDTKFRRKGVASDLLNTIEKYALSQNVSIIDVTSSQKREAEGAYTFYEKFGYINQGKENSKEARQYFRKRII